MTTVLLVRHGLTDYNTSRRVAGRTPGVSLNREGQAQAAAVARRLAALPIKAVYASPLERTRETAEAIAGALNLPVVPRPGLLETDTGAWTGRLFQDVQTQDAAIWTALQAHPRATRIPGGETMEEIATRMVAEIEAIRAAHPDDMVVVVSHADPIKTAIAHYVGLDLDYLQRLSISPTSVSILTLGEHGSQLIAMNHTGDLPDPTHTHKPETAARPIAPAEERHMPKILYEMKLVNRITASAVGLPGQRTFYIQAREGERLLTLLCEKQQVAMLALGIEELLDEVDRQHPESEPARPVPDSDLALEEPLEPAFRIGQLGLGFDQEANAIVIVAYELPESEETDPETLSAARLWMSRSQARALTQHAATVVASGRPLCPLCGEPMDASGHICPKKNGHKTIEPS